MQIMYTVEAFRDARAKCDVVGFVPTMGYLHEGHLSLVRRAKSECGAVVVSIFVNPTQFGPGEDFERYPRDSERDLALLRQEGVDLVFIPSVTEMYPENYTTYVNVEGVTYMLEGVTRPLHFQGVTTVVCKLLNIVQPQRAYFGQKDAQQTVVVRTMVRDLNMPIAIIVVPIFREPDGLAMSSRNTYLSKRERQAATVLYRALMSAKKRYEKGVYEGETLRKVMRQMIEFEPLASMEYVSVAHPKTLQELDHVGEDGALLSLAVHIGTTRLIDNILVGSTY